MQFVALCFQRELRKVVCYFGNSQHTPEWVKSCVKKRGWECLFFLRFNLNSINKKRRINILRFLLHSYSIEIVLNYFFTIFTVISKAALSFKRSLRCFNPAIYESTLVGSFDTVESSNLDGFLPPK